MSEVRELNEVERDALREVANIGAGHAATALSRMTDRTIMIDVPRVRDRRLDTVTEALGDPESMVTAVLMNVMGDLTGRTGLVFSLADTRTLCDLLLRREAGSTTGLGAMEESSVKETGNILTSAYLTALSDFMGMMLLPTVPTLVGATVSEVVRALCSGLDQDHDVVFLIDTAFRVEGAPEVMRGEFLLLPDSASVEAIFDAIHLG